MRWGTFTESYFLSLSSITASCVYFFKKVFISLCYIVVIINIYKIRRPSFAIFYTLLFSF